MRTFTQYCLQNKTKKQHGVFHYLLHGQLNGGFAVGELCFNAGALHLSHHVLQPLRLLQHLPVASTKLAQHSVGNVRDGLCRVPQCSPKCL